MIIKNQGLAKYYFKALHLYDQTYNKTPLLIFQMGKVGSSTIYNTVKKYIFGRNIYHVHNLNQHVAKSQIDWGIQKIKESGQKRQYPELWHSLYLSERIKKETKEKWQVITLVRDPVARNLSWFFQVMDRLYPEIYADGIKGKFNSKLTEKSFLNVGEESHKEPLVWFDSQIKLNFHVDVYSKPFSKHKGYEIYENEKARILVIRLEDIDNCAAKALTDFLNIDNIDIVSTNRSSDKKYKAMYKCFLESIKLDNTYLDKMYNSKFTRHFYTEDEIENFRKRWAH